MSPLPILLGVGLLILVASGNSASAAPAGPSAAYNAGYAVGYKDGAAKKVAIAAPGATAAATASGNAADYALGYAAGYADGKAAAAKTGTATTTTTTSSTGCMDADAAKMHTLAAYQRALIAAGSLTATSSSGKKSDDGICGPATKAAIKSFQASKGLTQSSTIDKATAWQLETYMSVTDKAGAGRAPVTHQMIRLSDSKLNPSTYYGEFVISNPDMTGVYADFDATKMPDGFYQITKVYYSSLSDGLIPYFDRGWLFVPDGAGGWKSTV